MPWWIGTLIVIYIIGFVAALALNLTSGPLTFSLCLLRALVWPIWVATGWPQGVRMGTFW